MHNEPDGPMDPDGPIDDTARAPAEPVTEERPDGETKKRKKRKPTFGSDKGIETMFKTSYRTHMDLSALADTKANIMISINGIVISIILASISPKIDANPWLAIPTSVLLIGCLASLVFAILSAMPRVSSNRVTLEDVRANRSNILFFGNFVNMPEQDYLVGMQELLQNTDQLYINMMRDIYSLGGVLTRKFSLLRKSYGIFMWTLLVGVGLYLLTFLAVIRSGLGEGPVIP